MDLPANVAPAFAQVDTSLEGRPAPQELPSDHVIGAMQAGDGLPSGDTPGSTHPAAVYGPAAQQADMPKFKVQVFYRHTIGKEEATIHKDHRYVLGCTKKRSLHYKVAITSMAATLRAVPDMTKKQLKGALERWLEAHP